MQSAFQQYDVVISLTTGLYSSSTVLWHCNCM